MYTAKVIGNVVSTKKEESLVGFKLLVIQRIDSKLQNTGYEEVAADYVGAGIGDYVLVGRGSSVRVTEKSQKVSVDTAIIGIIDTIDV